MIHHFSWHLDEYYMATLLGNLMPGLVGEGIPNVTLEKISRWQIDLKVSFPNENLLSNTHKFRIKYAKWGLIKGKLGFKLRFSDVFWKIRITKKNREPPYRWLTYGLLTFPKTQFEPPFQDFSFEFQYDMPKSTIFHNKWKFFTMYYLDEVIFSTEA
jgi:hypothetical protein